MPNQKGSWIAMEKTQFRQLTLSQQEEIKKLIESDFKAAKVLFEEYTSGFRENNSSCKSSN